ncbi:MAG: hypothetical protein IKZ92_02685 [Muribaculaceae bacterium]|nr:hypothetical protein [Muribaculaceae bacterium]
MKNVIHLILFLLIMVASLVTGCGGSRQYDHRLTTVDSILRCNPDSALSMLGGMACSEFGSPHDKAYYSLLLTQARYRCYVTATNDSSINLALDYFLRQGNDREKLTRALIYKGAVMEELDQADSAMTYFKQAREIIAPDDHFNLGYVKLRIGNLYRNHTVADSSDIVLFKEALHDFEQVPDSFYVLTCLAEIGSSYMKNNPDSVLPYLYRARDLAQELDAVDLRRINDYYIALKKSYSKDPADIDEAKTIALALIAEDEGMENIENVYMTATLALAKQNKTDSALLYLHQVDRLATPHDSIQYYMCHAEIARSQGDIDRFKYYFKRSDEISDSLSTNGLQLQLRDVEAKYDNESLKYENLRYKTVFTVSLMGLLLALSVVSIVLLVISRISSRRQQQLKDSEDTIERMRIDASTLSAQLKANKRMSEGLKNTISKQIGIFTRLVELHRTLFGRNPTKFGELFEQAYSTHKPDLSFWSDIRAYADSVCDNLVTRTQESMPSLNENDIRFLSLCCCNLPSTVIMACMGYKEVHSVYNKKRRLAQKMNLPEGLDELVEQYFPPLPWEDEDFDKPDSEETTHDEDAAPCDTP